MIHPTSGKGRLGTRVRVRELGSGPDELQGPAGTIMRSFGHPDHAAHDVLLDSGASYQLKDEPLRDRRPPTIHRSA